MDPRFEQFIQERKYLLNVSPATLDWYKHSLKWLPTASPSQDELKDTVLRMKEKGLKATGCNSAIRAINAYLKWAESPLKIQQLKEPQLILPTFSAADIKKFLAWKPKGFYEIRLGLHALLRHQGCLVLAHPSSNGKNTRPDYRVTQPDGSVFILEARTSTTIPTGPVNEQRRNRIVDRLRELRLDGFALGIAEVSAGIRDLRWASLERHIRTELAKFRSGADSFSIPTFINDDGWRVRLTGDRNAGSLSGRHANHS